MTVTETAPSDTTETDIFGDTTDTTDPDDAIGQGVDQTCADFVTLFTLAKEADFANGGDSVFELQAVADEATELAGKAPSVLRSDLTSIAEAYRSYISLLSERGLEPGPDALLLPEVDEIRSGVSAFDLESFIDESCDEEVKAQLEFIVTG